MIAAAVLVLIAAASIPLLNRQGKEQTTAVQETSAAQEKTAAKKTTAAKESTGSAAAAANEKGEVILDGVEYRIYEDHAVVFGYDAELETLEIPSRINDVPVTEISSYWNVMTTGTNLKKA